MTVSSVFDSLPTQGHPTAAIKEGRDVPAGPRARVTTTEREIKPVGWVRRKAAVIRSDVAGAWPWRGSAPTLLDLWRSRIPAIEQVPGNHKAVRVAWIVANHVALPATAYLSTLLWSLQHPARYPLAGALLAPVLYLVFG